MLKIVVLMMSIFVSANGLSSDATTPENVKRSDFENLVVEDVSSFQEKFDVCKRIGFNKVCFNYDENGKAVFGEHYYFGKKTSNLNLNNENMCFHQEIQIIRVGICLGEGEKEGSKMALILKLDFRGVIGSGDWETLFERIVFEI